MKRSFLSVLTVILLVLLVAVVAVHDVAWHRIVLEKEDEYMTDTPVPAVRFWQTWCVKEDTPYEEIAFIMGARSVKPTLLSFSAYHAMVYALPNGNTIEYSGNDPVRKAISAPKTTAAVITAVTFYASVVIAAALLACVVLLRKQRKRVCTDAKTE